MNIIEELNNKNKKLLTLVGQEAVIVNDIYNQIHLQRKLQEVEIKKFKLEKNTDYTHIKSDTKNTSLFSHKSIYIFSTSNLNYAREAKDLIIELTKNTNDDIILFHYDKDDIKAFKNSKFYNEIRDLSYDVFALQPAPYQFKNAIQARAKLHNISFDSKALDLFITLIDGNFTFAENELKRLNLIYGGGKIGLKEIAEMISGNAKYDGFVLLDQCIAGKIKETKKILGSLREDNYDPIMLNGLLSWFFKPIIKMKLDAVDISAKKLEDYRVYGQSQENSKNLYKYLSVKQVEACLLRITEIDLISKGIKFGDAWNELEKFILGLCRIIYRKKAGKYEY